VIHVVTEKFTDLTAELAELREEPRAPTAGQAVRERMVRSRDFH
jgi:error-prone DNA polymerase